MREYELIDRYNNDEHERGTREEMQEFADQRNADERANPDTTDVWTGKGDRWTVKPDGFASQNFKGF